MDLPTVLRTWIGHVKRAADDVLTTELISACFDHPITIEKSGGRWAARAS